MESIKLVKDEVRAMVHARNDCQQINDNKKKESKKKAPIMMLVAVPEEPIDIENDYKW